MFTKEQLTDFLNSVDKEFPVPLSYKVDLNQYAEKLRDKATLCSICNEGRIEALVAGYTENLPGNIAYISLVAVRRESRRKGYAKNLVLQFLSICREKEIAAVHLYAHASNAVVINMYEKIGFEKYVISDEPRPDDVHLIYWIKR